MTRTENHHLSCSVTSEDSCRYKVRWLYGGKPYAHPEPIYGDQHNVTLCQDCEETQLEELFSCEVWSDCPDDVKLFSLKPESEGQAGTSVVLDNKATTLTITTRWSNDIGGTDNNPREYAEDTQPPGDLFTCAGSHSFNI